MSSLCLQTNLNVNFLKMDFKDPNKICRLCLVESSTLRDLIGTELQERIEGIFQIELITSEPNLPQNICKECNDFVIIVGQFKEKVSQNQNLLKEDLEQVKLEVKIEVIEDDSTLENENLDAGNTSSADERDETRGFSSHLTRKKIILIGKRKQNEILFKKKEEKFAKRKTIERVSVEERDRVIKEFMAIKCDICEEEGFDKFIELINHTKEKHGKSLVKIRCETCNIVFHRRSFLFEHISVHQNPDKYKCNKCGKTFSSKRYLKYHDMVHWPKDKRIFPCDSCNKSFVSKNRLNIHKMSHIPQNELRYKCDHCEKRFPFKGRMQTHILVSHSNQRDFFCEVCAKSFACKTNLEVHIQACHDKKQPKVQCLQCGKFLTNTKSLNAHVQRVHKEAGPFKCDDCKYVAPNKSALMSHRKRNHAPIPNTYPCKFCEKALRSKQTLREHEATHTGARLYTCKFCPLEFNSIANKSKHQKQKHPTEWEEWHRQRMEGII